MPAILPAWIPVGSLFVFFAWQPTASAVGITNDQGGFLVYPKGTTLNVYIDPDPDGLGRDALIKAGIQRWVDPLKAKGVTINITLGPTPGDAQKNYVSVKWAPAGSLKGDNANQDDLGDATPVPGTKGEAAASIAKIDRGVSGDTFIQNLGAHEFGHALGLADDTSSGLDSNKKPATNTMDPKIPSGTTTGFTDKDLAELDTTYGDAGGNFPQGAITATVSALPAGIFQYDYQVTWLTGPLIPLFQVGTNGSPVFDVIAGGYIVTGTNADSPTPDGWFLFDPRQDFTALGFLEDVPFQRLPPNANPPFLDFVNTGNPLGPGNSSFHFSFQSIAPPGTVIAFASGATGFVVTGPASIPEPSTFLLIPFGLIATAGACKLKGSGGQRSRRT